MPASATAAYEALRQRVVQPDGRIEHAEGRGVLMRCGLARWAQMQSTSVTVMPPDSHRHSTHHPEMLATLETELIQLVAGLILSMRQEVILA